MNDWRNVIWDFLKSSFWSGTESHEQLPGNLVLTPPPDPQLGARRHISIRFTDDVARYMEEAAADEVPKIGARMRNLINARMAFYDPHEKGVTSGFPIVIDDIVLDQ